MGNGDFGQQSPINRGFFYAYYEHNKVPGIYQQSLIELMGGVLILHEMGGFK